MLVSNQRPLPCGGAAKVLWRFSERAKNLQNSAFLHRCFSQHFGRFARVAARLPHTPEHQLGDTAIHPCACTDAQASSTAKIIHLGDAQVRPWTASFRTEKATRGGGSCRINMVRYRSPFGEGGGGRMVGKPVEPRAPLKVPRKREARSKRTAFFILPTAF